MVNKSNVFSNICSVTNGVVKQVTKKYILHLFEILRHHITLVIIFCFLDRYISVFAIVLQKTQKINERKKILFYHTISYTTNVRENI
jgi:hypothetical protein